MSHLLRPATVILASLACSLLTAALLLLTATHSLASLYTGVGAMGYFVSLQFASGDRWSSFYSNIYSMLLAGYSWLAGRCDLTGPGSSVVFLGANTGWLLFPPLASALTLSSLGPAAVLHLALALAAVHLATFTLMLRL